MSSIVISVVYYGLLFCIAVLTSALITLIVIAVKFYFQTNSPFFIYKKHREG